MGFMDALRGLFNSRDRPDSDEQVTPAETALDRDRDGRLLYRDDIIAQVKSDLEERRNARRVYELQWTLNSNFMAGNQFCDINTHHLTIENYAPVYEWQEHNAYNRIAPLMETRHANLKSDDYLMSVKPRTGEIDDWEKAKISTQVLRYYQDTTDFDKQKNIIISWAELCGTAFVMSWWDATKGDEVAEIVDASVDENGETHVKRKKVYSGDLNYGLLSAYEVFPANLYQQEVEDQRSIIIDQIMSVDDIYDIYGVELEGSSVDKYVLTAIDGGGGLGYITSACSVSTETVDDSEHVITYFERKSRRYPDGRLIIIIGDVLVYYGALPYDEIPITAIKCKPVAGCFYGKSVIEEMIPLQRAYNGCVNKIHDYIKYAVSNTMLVPEGSIDPEELEAVGIEPGKIIAYKPEKGDIKPLQNGELPSEVINERNTLAKDMEYVSGTSQLMVTGQTPSGVTSGTAIENLRQIDSTRLSLTAENIRDGVRSISIQWLHILKKYATSYRIASVSGKDNMGSIVTWCCEDINSFDVQFDTENKLENSDEVMFERFMQAWQMGLLIDDSGQVPREIRQYALERFKIGDFREMMSLGEQQRTNARNENSMFDRGIIPKIDEFDDHEIHIDEHLRYVLQMDFRLYERKNPEYAKLFREHINQHKAIIQQRIQEQQAAMMMAQLQQGGQAQNG